MTKVKKQISQKSVTFGTKEAKSTEEPDSFLSKQPSWRFEKTDTDYKWNIANEEFSNILNSLSTFERMTWGEIFRQTHDNGRSSNHYISPDKMCKEAQKRFSELNLDEHADHVYSLRIANKIRIFGLLYNGVFSVLW